MAVYYNEIDPFCCAWLRQLIKRGLIPDGEIDNRSIEDVRPDELREFTQCHFFAGIGGWPYALRLAVWPDDRPVWTGSCPCQPFSAAGKRAGTSDERHLWPSFFWLISQCRPDTIIGEQVASKDALAWWDIVYTDLEREGYACGICDTCAAGFGAPHIRQRLYWVGNAVNEGLERHARDGGSNSGQNATGSTAEASESDVVMPTNGFWANPDWLWCRDKKWRPLESGIVPLVDGIPKGVVRGRDRRTIRQRLQGYGNAIVVPQAVDFIKAVMEII